MKKKNILLIFLLVFCLAFAVGCNKKTPEKDPEPVITDPVKPAEPPKEDLITPIEPEDPNAENVVIVEARGLAESKAVEDCYFDDVVMIGDSVTLKLYYYLLERWNVDPAYLGGIQFLTAGSLGSGNALWAVSEESVHPVFEGEKMLLEDSVALCGAKKVYLMLGTNDVGLYGVEEAITNYNTLLDRIQTKSPDVKFYIQSALPMLRSAQLQDLNNPTLAAYNEALYAMVMERGDYFVDVASVMQTSDGCLPYQYCSDPDGLGIHLTDIACDQWISYLRSHTAQ
ncbi:MAG TPA: GDSL-type esterase/lipase family protein [Bacillota bacterium]|nr:GDSL-type esterase/lipase family protein [Bacillota bacterium]